MANRFQEFYQRSLAAFFGLPLWQRLLASAVTLALVVFLFFTLFFATKGEVVYLFRKPLSQQDYGLITAELQKQGVPFKTLEDKYVLVEDEATGTKVRMTLAQNNLLPQDLKGWELFDMDSWTTTEFDRNVKLRRAVEAEMKRHLESLDWIESVAVSLSYPENSLYTERDLEVEAAVSIRAAEGYRSYLQDKKLIKGIENVVAKGVDGLSRDHIVITDSVGRQLNDFLSDDYEDQLKQAALENKIADQERRKIKKKIEAALGGMLSPSRYRVAVDIELNFNRRTVDQKEILPVVIKERTPNLPYDDSVVRDTIKVSDKKVTERFEGMGFIPEGPPGQEPNLPPGYKESLDGKNKYSKDEEINNYVNGEKVIKQVDDAMEIERKSVSVVVDGVWSKRYDEEGNLIVENETIKRQYTPVSPEEIKKLQAVVQGAINYSVKRGDQVVVKEIAFDRFLEFQQEDEAYFQAQANRLYVLYGVVSLLSLLLLIVAYRFFKAFMEERRKKREREEERLKLLQREAAIRDLESGRVLRQSEMSKEERENLELQQEILGIVDREADKVAKVLTFWLSEEEA